MFDSRDVAAYIAQQCIENGFSYNNTKIQKLLYCCYGAILAIKSERICDEFPRAWQYGPVFPKVFKAISKGSDLAQYSFVVKEEAPEDIKRILNKAILTFGKYTATSLSRWSHKSGSPWDIVVNEVGKMNDFIPDNLITKFFKEHVVECEDYA